jgi:streptogramin lyase
MTEIDARSGGVIQTVGIGAQATEVAIARDAVWVATGIDNTVVKIDARTGGRVDTIRLPYGAASAAYAIAASDGAVWVISGAHALALDSGGDVVVKTACCSSNLRDIAVGDGSVWVNTLGESVVRVSAKTTRVNGFLNLGQIPTALTLGYGSVWVGSSGGPRLVVWRVNPHTVRVEQTTTIGKTESFLATVDLAAGAGSIWATDYDGGTLVQIDPGSGDVVRKIHLGHHPRGIAVGAGRVWVTIS